MSMANMSTRRQRESQEIVRASIQHARGFRRRLFVGGPTADIVLLDQDTSYDLDLKKKRYTQTSLAEQCVHGTGDDSNAAGAAVATTIHFWRRRNAMRLVRAKVSVKKAGEKAVIATYEVERVTITATQACTDKQTGQVCESRSRWINRPHPDLPAADESLVYDCAYAQKMGLNAAASRDFAERAETMFGGYKGIWGKVAAELKVAKGYPLKSTSLSASVVRSAGLRRPRHRHRRVGDRRRGASIGSAIGGMFGKKKADQAAAQPAAPPTIARWAHAADDH